MHLCVNITRLVESSQIVAIKMVMVIRVMMTKKEKVKEKYQRKRKEEITITSPWVKLRVQFSVTIYL